MSRLKRISETVQQVAEAISHAIGFETEIVDKELTIIGGTGLYMNKLGKKEELGQVNGDYLYARVLREGKSVVIEDAREDITYDHLAITGETVEMAEICTPIKVGDEIIGIIGMVAFDKQQKEHLIKNKVDMVQFIERMADLLSAKAAQTEFLQQVQVAKEEITTILETIHEGMIAVDERGYITYCNSTAEFLLRRSREVIIGNHLKSIMPGTSALQVINTGKGYTEQEEIFSLGNREFNFIMTTKPIKGNEKLNGVVISFRDILEAKKLVYNMSKRTVKYTFEDIIGSSDSISKVKSQGLLVARGNSTVLITGESGTGKELFAKAIHYTSDRRRGSFITVNCGAIPENLIESELFGYEKGAFTGAKEKGKVGKFELANGGTIFLDEIGELPLHMQVKLLHVLQNKRFERIGGNNTILVDVRVIAATNRDLEVMIKNKNFRADLYYRLSVIPLKTPPLRERNGDIDILKDYFLMKYSTYMNKNITRFTKEVEEIYENYDWPGNVRELENAVEYGVNMTFTDEIGIDAIPPRMRKLHNYINYSNINASLQEQMQDFEKEILEKKIKEYGNSYEAKVGIAKELKINKATLYRKIAKYNLS